MVLGRQLGSDQFASTSAGLDEEREEDYVKEVKNTNIHLVHFVMIGKDNDCQ